MTDRIHVVKVPDVGEGITEVEVVAWHVQPGDAVVEDQALADVMTDKANVEIPSPVAGRVLALGGDVGQTLAVGAELIRIERPGDAELPVPGPAQAAPPPSPAAKLATVRPAPATERARPASQPTGAVPDRAIASPAVRRRAWELGVDLQRVSASGTAGRIMHADLDTYIAEHGAQPPVGAPATGGAERNDQQEVAVIGLRRRIALQMQESKRRIPHFSYVEEIDVTEVEGLRSALNKKWAAERGHLTLLPLLMRATVLAVREFPQVNALFDDEAGIITRHGAVHIGIATQTRHGLVVPVVRHVEARDLWSMAAEMARLADAAREGRATRAELSGSTITISSLGALGGIVSTPVINRPEVAIVAVNRIVERPVWRGAAVVPRLTMNLSSSFDHRMVDGIDAARFVQAIRAVIEAPALLFVD